ncbi:MAG: hypothetical protein WD382_03440 [Halofilum sp. (in: g-proteobacteria)]
MELISDRKREDVFEVRRRFLVRALTLGLFVGWGATREALAMASPRAMTLGQSIYRLSGPVWVDGRRADADTRVAPDAELVTGSGSELVFVVGTDAFILRENSRLALTPVHDAAATEQRGNRSILLEGLHLLSGKLLSVFGQRERARGPDLRTPVATIGIRGTGVYLEAETDRTYVCTCYGTTELRSLRDAQSRERVASSHHDEPRYVVGEGRPGQLIEPAPMINHTDMELELVEALVGRKPPFAQSASRYDRY